MYTNTGTLDRTLDRETMLEQFAPLVRRLAHHLVARLPASVQVDDLIQAGLIGLVDAIGRYRDDQGAQFETFATQRIRGAMLDELRSHDWLPRGMRRLQKKLATALDKAEQKLGRAPTEVEVAAEMGVPLAEYQQMLDEAHGGQLFYLEDLGGGDDEESYLDRNTVEEKDTPMLRLEDERFRETLVAAIEGLPEREKLLMGLYYDEELNFKEIAAVLGVSESRVCQLHGQAVNRLRAKLKDWR
jgi:RNA polymerase sigma factor for flagellar operon FliA